MQAVVANECSQVKVKNNRDRHFSKVKNSTFNKIIYFWSTRKSFNAIRS